MKNKKYILFPKCVANTKTWKIFIFCFTCDKTYKRVKSYGKLKYENVYIRYFIVYCCSMLQATVIPVLLKNRTTTGAAVLRCITYYIYIMLIYNVSEICIQHFHHKNLIWSNLWLSFLFGASLKWEISILRV